MQNGRRKHLLVKSAEYGGCMPYARDHFSLERHLIDRQIYRERRSAAPAEWQVLVS
jgi:hypothetical protein